MQARAFVPVRKDDNFYANPSRAEPVGIAPTRCGPARVVPEPPLPCSRIRRLNVDLCMGW